MSGRTIRPSRTRAQAKPDAVAPAVTVRTLGEPRIRIEGEDQNEDLGTRHRALVALLVRERRPMYPSEVIDLLGQGREEDEERDALERAVRWLNEKIPRLRILLSADTIQLAGNVTSDVEELESALERGDFEAVRGLYRAEFLEGFEAGNEAFDEWAAAERTRLTRLWRRTLVGTANEAEQDGRWSEAAAWWKLLVVRHPKDPEALSRGIRACRKAGDDEGLARLEAVRRGEATPSSGSRRDERTGSPKAARGDTASETSPTSSVVPPVDARPARPARPGADREPAASTEEDEPFIDLDDIEAVDPTELEPASPPTGGARARGTGPEGPGAVDDAEETPSPIGASVAGGADEGRRQRTPEPVNGLDPRDVRVIRPTRGPVPPARREPDGSGLFTDSLVIHLAKTTWAKLTTPHARRRYQTGIENLVEMVVLPLRLLGQGALWAGDRGGELVAWSRREVPPLLRRLRARWRQMDLAGRMWNRIGGAVASAADLLRRTRSASRSSSRSIQRASSGVLGRIVAGATALATAPVTLARLASRTAARLLRRTGAAVARILPFLRRRAVLATVGGAALAGLLLSPVGRSSTARIATVAASAEMPEISPSALWPWGGSGSAATESKPEPSPESRPEPSPASTPESAPDAASFDLSVPRIPAPRIAMPDVALPSVEVPRLVIPRPGIPRPPLPDLSEAWTRVVEGPGARVGELIGRPLVERGARVIVADPRGDLPPDLTGPFALLLETRLSGATRFETLSRERVLVGLGREGPGMDLAIGDARAAAPTVAADAIVSAAVAREDQGYRIRFLILGPDGEERHAFREMVPRAGVLDAADAAAVRIAARLGHRGLREPASPIRAGNPEDAWSAYVRARGGLFAGRYRSALRSAREAVRLEPGLAPAHVTLARARALLGGRRGARRSLQDAWRHRARLSERERLRVQADLLAFDGHYTDAILTYERLLSIDGNDVAAMKSLAVLQRMIRAPGRGRGNLRVAYALDPVDWPPIRRLARYYGYRGPLPDPTRLAAVDLEAIRR